MLTVLDVAGLPLAHVKLEVSTALIASPSVGIYAKVGLFIPTVVAPLYHWYEGAPPFTGMAVKVTVVPAHILLASEEMDTLTGRRAFTVVAIDEVGTSAVHPNASV